jgi:hypothetical protein
MMLRQPIARGVRRSRTTSIQAPVGGWNAASALADMPKQDAVLLDNWFPSATEVRIRKGALFHSTGATGSVLSLAAWNGPSSSKMFAATNSGIHDVTVAGAFGPALIGITLGDIQSVNFTTLAGHYLIVVNGQDRLMVFDGLTWTPLDGSSSPAITGLVTTSLKTVAVIKRRLWFSQRQSLSAWYLPLGAIGGALTEFPMGQIFARGGSIRAINTWTIDGGSGSDDYAVFASSEGEIAIYKGTDPASADTWAHVGTYYIGEPIGENCLTKFGGDLLFLSQAGVYPLSKALQSSSINRSMALSSKIDFAFADSATKYGSNKGWQACIFHKENACVVNVPISLSETHQYVMNTVTGAWCRFTGWLATYWIVFNGELYFSSNNNVCKAFVGLNDFGANVIAKVQQAYSYMGAYGIQKHLKLLRPTLVSSEDVNAQLGVDVDFETSYFTSIPGSTESARSKWNFAIWNSSLWASGPAVQKRWATVFARQGYSFSFRMQVASRESEVSWSATDFVYEVGGVL